MVFKFRELRCEARDHASDVLRVLLENPSLDGENDPVQMEEVRRLIELGLEDREFARKIPAPILY